MFKKLKSHFNRNELRSIGLSFIAAMITEQALAVVWGGDLSREALAACGFAIIKSFLKAIFEVEIKPQLMSQTTITATSTTPTPPPSIPN